MSKFVLLLLAYHLEVRASIGSPVMCRTEWPTTYTRYFALQMQLRPALHVVILVPRLLFTERETTPSHPLLSTWGAVMLKKKNLSKLIFEVPTTSGVPLDHIVTNNTLLHVNANRKLGKSPIIYGQ